MSTDCHLTASANGKYVTQVVQGSYHLQLIRFDLNSTLQSAGNCFYCQDYEQSSKDRAMVDPTIHTNFFAVIINKTDMVSALVLTPFLSSHYIDFPRALLIASLGPGRP